MKEFSPAMATLLVDTHAHLCAREFEKDRAAVLRHARQEGVGAIIIVGENMEDARRNIGLASQYPGLKPAAGIYPEYADIEAAEQMVAFIQEHKASLSAIGEVGLDFWIASEDSARDIQREVFCRFITLAGELNLPLNVHARSAGRQAVALLLANNATRVQMHAFDGKASAALPAVEAGYFFSVPPSIVRSRQKQKLVKQLPLSCLLLESDSPVLGPDPSLRNEPANILIALQAIAEIKDVLPEQVREAVCENTRQLYGDLVA